MPQSLARVLVHVVFSTKYRARVLTKELRGELHPYLATVLTDLGCLVLQVGGVEDHVHCLLTLPRTKTIAQLIEEVKVKSSRWLKSKSPAMADFHWQGGYGAFSIQYDQEETTILYIQNQEEHHRRVGFQDEYRTLLEQHRIAYDERYVWD